MKSKYWIYGILALAVIGVIFISGCIQQSKEETVTCNPPYIKVGTECCLDKNSNNICDKDETPTQPQTYCGDGICQSDESCSSCPSDCGECRAKLGESCSWNDDCESGYCVHGTCRSSSTYCGDGYCDSGESYSSCPQDCEKPVLFMIGDSTYSPGDTLTKLGENYYRVSEAHTGDTIGTITFPLSFNSEARDVEFDIGCYDIDNLGRLDSHPNEYDPKEDIRDSIVEGDKSLGFFAYFGYGSADPFILTNNKDFGAEIEYTNKGSVRVLIFPSSNWGNTREFKCTLTVTSHNPPERKQKEFKLRFT